MQMITLIIATYSIITSGVIYKNSQYPLDFITKFQDVSMVTTAITV